MLKLASSTRSWAKRARHRHLQAAWKRYAGDPGCRRCSSSTPTSCSASRANPDARNWPRSGVERLGQAARSSGRSALLLRLV